MGPEGHDPVPWVDPLHLMFEDYVLEWKFQPARLEMGMTWISGSREINNIHLKGEEFHEMGRYS